MLFERLNLDAHFRLVKQAQASIEKLAHDAAPSVSLRQPLHVMYGGAQLFSEDRIPKIGQLALKSLQSFAADGPELKTLLRCDWSSEFSTEIYSRVCKKLQSEPVEDYRIDFEDGYGVRTDEEEDLHAVGAAKAVAQAAKFKNLPPYMGIRIKPLAPQTFKRAVKTLCLFVEELAQSKPLPLQSLTVALPKVTNVEQIQVLSSVLDELERRLHVSKDFFFIELLIEAPQALFSLDGRFAFIELVRACGKRCRGLHFGAYDFVASLGAGSSSFALDDLNCDYARTLMITARGFFPHLAISDGVINALPLAPADREPSSKKDWAKAEDIWRSNFRLMTRSLENGIYQGWDLHPSQVAIRYVANFAYLLKEWPEVERRLQKFVDVKATATRTERFFDDRASILGLVNFVRRAVDSRMLDQKTAEFVNEVLPSLMDWLFSK